MIYLLHVKYIYTHIYIGNFFTFSNALAVHLQDLFLFGFGHAIAVLRT